MYSGRLNLQGKMLVNPILDGLWMVWCPVLEGKTRPWVLISLSDSDETC